MTALLASVEILQLINQFIVSLVSFIETFGVYIMAFSLLFFCIWLIIQVGALLRDLLQKMV